MYVFELVQPGCWLAGFEDDQVRRDVESLLRLLVGCVDDAAVSLNMFEQSRHASIGSSDDRMATWAVDRDRERAIEANLKDQLPSDMSFEDRSREMDKIHEFARREAKRQKWQEGQIPEGYQGRIPFIHAKSCLYALDILQKAISLLVGLPGTPSAVAEVMDEFKSEFPDLVHVRNSAHHAEDRSQGKQRGERIQPRPLSNDAIHAPSGGVLVVELLNGNRYGGTLADGSFGEVEVSEHSVATAQRCVQRVLDAFEWTGPVMHLPR